MTGAKYRSCIWNGTFETNFKIFGIDYFSFLDFYLIDESYLQPH